MVGITAMVAIVPTSTGVATTWVPPPMASTVLPTMAAKVVAKVVTLVPDIVLWLALTTTALVDPPYAWSPTLPSPRTTFNLQFAVQSCAGVACNPDSIICSGGLLASNDEMALGCICVNRLGEATNVFGIIESTCLTSMATITVENIQINVAANDSNLNDATEVVFVYTANGSLNVKTLIVGVAFLPEDNDSSVPTTNAAYTVKSGNGMPSCYGAATPGTFDIGDI